MSEENIKLPETIRVWDSSGLEEMTVETEHYIVEKTKVLVEFGYTDLTEGEVRSQLREILGDGSPNVIGRFIMSDLVMEDKEDV
jgi:hypothetical protein